MAFMSDVSFCSLNSASGARCQGCFTYVDVCRFCTDLSSFRTPITNRSTKPLSSSYTRSTPSPQVSRLVRSVARAFFQEENHVHGHSAMDRVHVRAHRLQRVFRS